MAASAQIQPQDQPLDRLMKSVPAEFAATFLALNSFLADATNVDENVLKDAAVIMLVILPLYLWKVRGIKVVSQHVATWLAFAIFVVNIAGSELLGTTAWYHPEFGGAAVILWAVIAPIITTQKNENTHESPDQNTPA